MIVNFKLVLEEPRQSLFMNILLMMKIWLMRDSDDDDDDDDKKIPNDLTHIDNNSNDLTLLVIVDLSWGCFILKYPFSLIGRYLK